MGRKILRWLGYATYAGALVFTAIVAAYLAFSLFVRSGVTRTPNVVGMAREEATLALADRGLGVTAAETGRFSETIEAGHVFEQRPATGSLVKRGSTVEIVLSMGPQRLRVPDLTQQAVPSAQVALTAAGLTLGRTVGVYSERGAPGMVVDQFPPAGSQVAPSTPIDLMIAQGGPASDAYLMPDLIYRDYDRVRRFLERWNMRLGTVRFESYAGVRGGVILRQFPLAGHPLGPRDAVSLVVTAYEEPAF